MDVAPSPKVGYGNDLIAFDFRGPGRSYGLGDMGPDRDGNRHHVDSIGRPASHLISHPVNKKILERNPHHQCDSNLSEGGKDPIPFLEDKTASDLTGLLAPNGRIGSKPSLTLKQQPPLVSRPDEDHLLIKGQGLLLINRRGKARLEGPVGF